MIERYSFISMSAYALVKDRFPHAISYGESKLVQYASPSQSVEMKKLVELSGIPFVKYDEVDAQMIINAIENGIDKIYNCNHDVALTVCNHFTKQHSEQE